MRLGLGFASLACLAASPAFADGAVDINRSVYIERMSAGTRALEPATTLKPGDKVVLVIAWRTDSSGRQVTVESAVPRALAFQRAGHDAVEVSTDGGRRWGELGTLKMGRRLATAEDVTHLRLRIAGERSGQMTFSAIVR